MGKKTLDKTEVFHKVSFYMEEYNLSVSNAIRRLMDEGEFRAHFNAIKSSFYTGRREYLKSKDIEESILEESFLEESLSEEAISKENNTFNKYWKKAKEYLINSFKELIS